MPPAAEHASALDAQVAALLAELAARYAALTPEARNPAPGTPPSPEAEQIRAELARLARLRTRLADRADAALPRHEPFSTEASEEAALAWLRSLDPASPTAVAEVVERLRDPLEELAGAPQLIDADAAARLIDVAIVHSSAGLADVLGGAGLGTDALPPLWRAGDALLVAEQIAPDAGVEVLAPLRIETRFTPPDAASGRLNWSLRVRVYPDEVSIARPPAPPTAEELDRVDEALAAPFRDPPVDEAAAFDALAGALGAPRAAWLLRTVPLHRPDPEGPPFADRSLVEDRRAAGFPVTHVPAGLPPSLTVWLMQADIGPGSTFGAVTLDLDRDAIARDVALDVFAGVGASADGELPETWWTSFRRALEVGLATEIQLFSSEPRFEAIVVTGLGDTAPDALFAAHAQAGQLAILPPGTPTNTVEGEPTTELGRDPDAWRALGSATGHDQSGTQAVLRALTGSDEPVAPLLGGHTDVRAPAAVLVDALWPALWGRATRDVAGAGASEQSFAVWASRFLSPEGPYPAVRVGEQPYGILPVTALERWVNHPADALDQDRLRRWAAAWRDDAAGFAEDRGTAVDAPTARLLELLGAAAPERSWGVRPVAGLPVARALRALFGLPLPDATSWDVATAGALAEAPSPVGPVAPVGPLAPLPGSPVDERDDPDGLREMIEVDSEPLVGAHWRLGLLGHLLRAALIISRATIGQAHEAHVEGLPVDPGAALPVLDTPPRTLFRLALHGSDEVLRDLEENGDEGAQVVVARFHAQRRAAHELVRRWEETPERIFAALLATLDTAAFRVDPWIVGVADSRLRLLAGRRPFRLGAYGWVDRPRSHSSGEALAPGPTAAGVLHAPSSTHALTAALLRDAAVRHAGDERWQLAIDSARVRAAVRLAERVRLGVHPYEALGLEAERLIGDWEHVRLLRRHFPLRGVGDDGDERRACDGRRVLAAVLRQEEPVPPGLPVEAAELLQPLADALDTYADLLVADGVHALVSGRADLANQAMEAAAGLGAPPELRAIRTPRGATGVRVAAWAVLPLGAPLDPAAAPAVVADPAFARLLDDELGPPAQWTWHVEGAGQISLAELGLHGSELLDTSGAELDAVLRGDAAGSVTSTGGGERLEAAGRLADLLGGGEDAPPLAGAVTGAGGLDTRLAELVAQASALLERLEALDPADAAAVAGGLADLRRWRIEAPTAADGAAAPVVAGARELRGRIAAAGAPGTDVDALRATLRALVGRRRLPVLPLAAAPVLPGLVPSPPDGGGRPAVDRTWLEIVAAVRPRLAALEAHQLGTLGAPWPAAVAGGGATGDPWAVGDQVTVVYGPGLRVTTGPVGVAALDAWVDSVPAREHATSAAFGFNGPKARPPQALLVAVPPDLRNRMTPDELLQAVLETRRLVRARAARPETAERVATPAPFLPADARIRLFREWHQ